MREEMLKAAMEVIELAMRPNRPGFEVFAMFSGHVNKLKRVLVSAWPREKPTKSKSMCTCDGNLAATYQQICARLVR